MKKNKLLKLIEDCSKNKSSDLNLTGLGIANIPDEIFELRHLTSLQLTNNNIKIIPAKIGQLSNLEFLGINYNLLEYLPVEIGLLVNLTSLDLWRNRLKSLPVELAKLTKLQHLHLGFNRLNSIPKELFYPISQLKGLDLQGNPFNDIPILRNLQLIDLLTFFRSENSFFCILEMPKELQAAFQQYLNFFSEFIEKTTGYNLPFEVTKVSNGLKITTRETSSLRIDKINSLLKEYVGFLRQEIPGTKGSVEKELMVLRVEEQKRHFESQIKFLEFENKYIKQKFDEVLASHLDLSGKAILQLTNNDSAPVLIKAIKEELNRLSSKDRKKIDNEILELETILKNDPNEVLQVKSKFNVIRELIIGASGSSISTGLIELFKLFI